MQNWIKLDGTILYIKDYSVQLSLGSHASLEIKLDNQREYSEMLFLKFESKLKFNLIGKQFEAKGVHIKGIDVSSNQITLSLRCDILDNRDISERREEIIDEVLNNSQNLK